MVSDDADWNRVLAESSDASINRPCLRRFGDGVDALDRKAHARAIVSGSGGDSLRNRTGHRLRRHCCRVVHRTDVIRSSAGGLCWPELHRGGRHQCPQIRYWSPHSCFMADLATSISNHSQSIGVTNCGWIPEKSTQSAKLAQPPRCLRVALNTARNRGSGVFIGRKLERFSLIGQRQFWRKPSVFVTRSVSEGLCLTRSLAYASGYYCGKSGAVQRNSLRSLNKMYSELW